MAPGDAMDKLKKAIKVNLYSLDELSVFVKDRLNVAEKAEIKLRLDDLIARRNDFLKLQSSLELLDDDELQSKDRATFDTNYYLLRPALEERLQELAGKTAVTPKMNEDLSFVPKLPQLVLDTFSGDITKWKSFSEAFHNHVHLNANLSSLIKFQYLKKSVDGVAARVFENLDFTADNYETARTLLLDRYDKPHIIAEEHIRALFAIKPVDKQNPQKLLEMLDEFNSHLRSLKTLGRPTDYIGMI